MGRMYSVGFQNQTIAALQDLLRIAPAANKPVVLHALFISQVSQIQDAEEEMWRLQIIRGFTTAGTGGAAVTPQPLAPIDTASGATCRRNDTTVATAGTPVIMHAEAFNVRAGYAMVWTPETRIKVSATQTSLHVKLMANPVASTTGVDLTAYFEEL